MLAAFVLSLAHTAAVHFGDIPDPVSGAKSPANLPAAQQMIDILALLEEKRGVQQGFEYVASDRVLLTYEVPLNEIVLDFYDRLMAGLESLPGVGAVALAGSLPPEAGQRRPQYEVAGRPPVDEGNRPRVPALRISPAYFRTLGATVLSGREFRNTDGLSGNPVVIVNERFAAEHWPEETALGRRLRLFAMSELTADDQPFVVLYQAPYAVPLYRQEAQP